MGNKKTLLYGIAIGIATTIFLNSTISDIISIFRKVSGSDLPPQQKITEIQAILDRFYVDEIDKKALEEGMYMGMVYGVGDPYTSYMDKNGMKKFKQDIEGTFAGIGLFVAPNRKTNRITVIAPFDGSPAAKAGIKPKDALIKVNGLDVFADTLSEAVAMMQGEPGTTVNITVYRESEGRSFDVDVTRQMVDVPTVFHKMLESDIGYIRLTNFEEVSYKQFMIAFDDLTKQRMKGLILDLRNNPGGLMDVVTKITDVLVPKGIIVYTEDKQGNTNYIYSTDNQIKIPLVVVVNGNSASASEVLAGAVKDLKAGILVGEQTFGKGLVQALYSLSDGSGVKVTIAKYYTPSGVCINGIGITPDHVVKMSEELSLQIATLTLDEDVQLKKAVEVIKKKMSV